MSEIKTCFLGNKLNFKVSGDGVCLSPFLCVPIE